MHKLTTTPATLATAKLRVVPFVNGSGTQSYRVTGSIGGQRVRENFREAQAAENRRLELLAKHASQPSFRSVLTRLTDEQVRDAEAALWELFRAHSGASLTECVQAYLQQHPAAESVSVELMLDQYLESRVSLGNRPSTLVVLKSQLQKFIEETGAQQSADITPTACQDWILADGLSPSASGDRRKRLCGWFNWAVKAGYMASNPAEGVELPRVRREALPGILSPEQAEALIQAARETQDGLMLGYFSVCLYSGIRPTEATRLTWQEVNLSERYIKVSERISKTGQRIVPICDRLAQLLDEVADKGLPVGAYLVTLHRQVRERAGLDFPWSGVNNDLLRHSYCSYHFAMNQNLEQLRSECGNSPEILRRNYIHPVALTEAKRFFATNTATALCLKTSMNSEQL